MGRLLTKKEVETIKEIESQIESLKKQQQVYKQNMLKKMNQFGLKKVEIDDVTFTVKESFERTDLDKKKLETDFPELVKKYEKKTRVSESLLIKL